MNVFLPIISLQNTFLDEIEKEFNGRFIYDHYRNIDNYEVHIVNIHWPEWIFSKDNYEYMDFKEWLAQIKTKYPVVYTRHNSVPHTLRSAEALEFNDFINVSCHAVHHYGYYSVKEHKRLYPNYIGHHIVIPHPLYKSLKNQISREEARNSLGIPPDAKVLLVFGVVRNDEERQLILRLIRKVNVQNKYLLVPNFGYIQAPQILHGSKLGNAWSKIRTAALKHSKNMQLDNIFVNDDHVQVYMNSADAVFIPRVNSLNSGVVFLAYSFQKNVIAPKVGNIQEHVLASSAVYDPNDFKSMVAATEIILTTDVNSKNDYSKYEPQKIAEEIERFFRKLIKELIHF